MLWFSVTMFFSAIICSILLVMFVVWLEDKEELESVFIEREESTQKNISCSYCGNIKSVGVECCTCGAVEK